MVLLLDVVVVLMYALDWDNRFNNKRYTNSLRCYIRDNLNFYYNYSLTGINISPHTKKTYVNGSTRDKKIKLNLNIKKVLILHDTIHRILPDKIVDTDSNYYYDMYDRCKRLRVYK